MTTETKEEDEHEISDARLVFHFDVEKPIELTELSRSLNAVAYLYNDFLIKHKSLQNTISDDDSLYVTKIRDNCILIELGPILEMLPHAADAMSQYNSFQKFIENFSDIINYFAGITGTSVVLTTGFKYSKLKTNAMLEIFKTVRKNKNGKLHLKTIKYKKSADGSEEVDINFFKDFPYKKIKDAMQGAEHAIKAFDETSELNLKNVGLRLTQANVGKKKRKDHANFRGIIDTVPDIDLPVFMNEADSNKVKAVMADDTQNPFAVIYYVDVDVKIGRNSKAKSYTISNLTVQKKSPSTTNN